MAVEPILTQMAALRHGIIPGQSQRNAKALRSARLAAARAKGTHTVEQWHAVLEQYNFRCVQCGCRPEPRPCKDHILPIYQGGSDGIENLQPLCRQCNSSKGSDAFNWAEYRDVHGFEEFDGPLVVDVNF
jgi:endonuclease I